MAMDDLTFLRSRIVGYADYRDQDARHLVDKQVRAYVGEAVARLSERLLPTGEAGEMIENVLMRCEFSDQRVIRAADHGSFVSDTLVDQIHEIDRALVEAADRAPEIDSSGLAGFSNDVCGLFDRRYGTISSAVPAP
jgi:hypothetical protein